MADSQSGFAALAPRQKMMAIIFLMIAIFIIWEMVGMFRGSKAVEAMLSPSPPAMAADAPVLKSTLPQAPPPAVHQIPTSTPTPIPKSIPTPTPNRPPPSSILTPQQSHPQVEMTLPTSNVFVQQEQVQNKYVSALNELQMLKIQKEIAETSQAIVAAKLATATAEKSISDLFSEASSIKGATTSSTLVVPLPPPAPKPIGSGYSVQSVSMGQDQWRAVVRFKNKLYSVGVGDLLPPDNSLVKAIDQNGVVIENAGMEQKIPLSMTDNVGTSETGSINPGT